MTFNYNRGKCSECGQRTTHKVSGIFVCLNCCEKIEMQLEDKLFEDSKRKSVALDIRTEQESKIDLIGFGDWHLGAVSCNIKAIKSQIEWIHKNPKARVILMGDMLDCGTKRSIGAGNFDNNIRPQQQYEYVLELLEPIKDKLYGIHIGNHEQRIFNETGMNVTKLMANALGTRYLGYSAFHKIKVGDINYVVFSTHGSSGATLPHTKIKRCLDLATFIDADIYMMGHVHALQVHTQEVKRVDMRKGTVVKDKKYFVLTGHYLEYNDSYADMKNMKPSKQGCARIRLDGKRKDAHVSI